MDDKKLAELMAELDLTEILADVHKRIDAGMHTDQDLALAALTGMESLLRKHLALSAVRFAAISKVCDKQLREIESLLRDDFRDREKKPDDTS